LEVIDKKSYLFFGEGQNLDIRVLSGPVIEENLGIGRIIFISFGGFMIGVLLTFLVFYYMEEYREYKEEEV